MQFQLCARYDLKQSERCGIHAGATSKWPRPCVLVARVDNCLDWITEKLDRKFVSAMERSLSDDPVQKQELNMLKRTVLFLVSIGLGMTAISIKLALETQLISLGLGSAF